MTLTTVLVAVLALIGAGVFSKLLLGKYRPFRKQSEMRRKVLIPLAYVLSVILLTSILVAIGMALPAYFVGIPLLFTGDAVGIGILARRMIIRAKRKKIRREIKEMRVRLKKLDAEIKSMNAENPVKSGNDSGGAGSLM